MARKYLMSWEGKPNYRWVKMYKGERHRVHCSELGLPPDSWTREDSYQAANDWWTDKSKALGVKAKTPQEKATAELKDLLGRLGLDGLRRLVEQGQAASGIVDVIQASAPEKVPVIEEAEVYLNGKALVPLPHVETVQARAKVLVPRVAPDFKLETQAKRFLAEQLARGMKPRTYGELATEITKLISMTHEGKAILAPGMDVREINERTVTDFYTALRSTKSVATQQRKSSASFAG